MASILNRGQPAVPKQLEKAVERGQQRRAALKTKRPDRVSTVLSDTANKLGG